jgi:hypothetical protein
MEIFFCTRSQSLVVWPLLINDDESLFVEHDRLAQTREVLLTFLFFRLKVVNLDALVLVGSHELLDVVDEGLFHLARSVSFYDFGYKFVSLIYAIALLYYYSMSHYLRWWLIFINFGHLCQN